MSYILHACRTLYLCAVFACFLFLALVTVQSARAASAPGDLRELQRQHDQILQQQEELRRRQEEEFRRRQDAPPSGVEAPRLEHQAPAPDAPCLEVKRVALSGATLLSERTLRSLCAPYENRCLTLADVTNLLRDITNAYIERGYITSRAFADPAQDEKGVLRVMVVEGTVEKIILNDGDADMYYRGRTAFPGLEGGPLNLRDIEQGLDQLNRLPSSDANMELVPGQRAGGTVVKVTYPRKRSWRGGGGADNLGQSSTGQMQYNLFVEKDNLMGIGDQFAAYWSEDARPLNSSFYPERHNDGHNHSFSAFFSVPWGYWTFSGNFSRFTYDSTIHGMNARYSSSGETATNSMQIERVLHRDAEGKTSLAASLNNRSVDSWIESTRLETGSYDLNTLVVTASHNRRIFGGVASAGLSWTRGLDTFGATKQKQHGHSVPQSLFDKYSASLSWYRPLSVPMFGGDQRLYWSLSAQGQLTPDTLYGPERIQIGGYGSVRGFREDSIAGDQGAYVRNEFGWDLPWFETLKNKGPVTGVQVYAAYDYGRLVADSRDPYERGTMQGAALGLRTLGDCSLNVSVARALDHPAFVRARDAEWYASIRYSF